MCYALNETVEICKKAEGFAGTYYRATVVAAIGYARYLVRYETRFFGKRNAAHLMEGVDPDEIRPLPPKFSYENRKLNDRVDAFIDKAWRVGRVTRFVDPNFYVRLDYDPRRVEHHCPFYNVRLHLEWRKEEWFYCHDDGPQVQNKGGNPDPAQADQGQNQNQCGNPDQAQDEQIQKQNPSENETEEAADQARRAAPPVAERTEGMFRCAVGQANSEEGKEQQPTE